MASWDQDSGMSILSNLNTVDPSGLRISDERFTNCQAFIGTLSVNV